MELRNCPECGGLTRTEARLLCSECGYPYWNATRSYGGADGAPGPVRYVTHLSMGRYKGQPVFWRPLIEESGRMLIISESIVDCQPYSEHTFAEDGFEKSGLRAWLNEVLLFDMFDTRERAAVEGEVLCLDAAQAASLFEDDADRIAFPTAYAALRAYGDERGNAECWWLADPGGHDCAQFVRHDGQVYPFGMSAEYNCGVRPALWVKNADACWRGRPYA